MRSVHDALAENYYQVPTHFLISSSPAPQQEHPPPSTSSQSHQSRELKHLHNLLLARTTFNRIANMHLQPLLEQMRRRAIDRRVNQLLRLRIQCPMAFGEGHGGEVEVSLEEVR